MAIVVALAGSNKAETFATAHRFDSGPLLWGKVGKLDACEGAYALIEPPPRISLTDLFEE